MNKEGTKIWTKMDLVWKSDYNNLKQFRGSAAHNFVVLLLEGIKENAFLCNETLEFLLNTVWIVFCEFSKKNITSC